MSSLLNWSLIWYSDNNFTAKTLSQFNSFICFLNTRFASVKSGMEDALTTNDLGFAADIPKLADRKQLKLTLPVCRTKVHNTYTPPLFTPFLFLPINMDFKKIMKLLGQNRICEYYIYRHKPRRKE